MIGMLVGEPSESQKSQKVHEMIILSRFVIGILKIPINHVTTPLSTRGPPLHRCWNYEKF